MCGATCGIGALHEVQPFSGWSPQGGTLDPQRAGLMIEASQLFQRFIMAKHAEQPGATSNGTCKDRVTVWSHSLR
eukprot:5598098-Amphidinium_carterae.1